MEFVKVAVVDDFLKENIKSFSILGKKVGVIKRSDGSFYAIETACKHQNADLIKGKIEFGVATCPRHDWQYDLETGECLNHDSPKLRKFALKIEGKNIKISMTPSD